MNKQTGITIAELMLVLGILALISLVAVPALSGLLMDTRMKSSVNELFHSLHGARQNAMLSGVSTVLCGSKNFRQCSIDGDWSDGWLIFANSDEDTPPRVTPGDRILRTGLNPAGVSISESRKFHHGALRAQVDQRHTGMVRPARQRTRPRDHHQLHRQTAPQQQHEQRTTVALPELIGPREVLS